MTKEIKDNEIPNYDEFEEGKDNNESSDFELIGGLSKEEQELFDLYDLYDATDDIEEAIKYGKEIIKREPDYFGMRTEVFFLENRHLSKEDSLIKYIEFFNKEKIDFYKFNEIKEEDIFKNEPLSLYGYHENRGFFRLIYWIIRYSIELGKLDIAEEFTKLSLQLNENDNLGTRFLAGYIYLGKENYQAIEDLKEKYDDSELQIASLFAKYFKDGDELNFIRNIFSCNIYLAFLIANKLKIPKKVYKAISEVHSYEHNTIEHAVLIYNELFPALNNNQIMMINKIAKSKKVYYELVGNMIDKKLDLLNWLNYLYERFYSRDSLKIEEVKNVARGIGKGKTVNYHKNYFYGSFKNREEDLDNGLEFLFVNKLIEVSYRNKTINPNYAGYILLKSINKNFWY